MPVQERERCDHNAPSRKQQQESAKFHELGGLIRRESEGPQYSRYNVRNRVAFIFPIGRIEVVRRSLENTFSQARQKSGFPTHPMLYRVSGRPLITPAHRERAGS